MKQTKEEVATISNQISFKERCVEAGAQEKHFKLCDQFTEEIASLQKNRRILEAELHGLEKKEQKKKFSPLSSDSESSLRSVRRSSSGSVSTEGCSVQLDSQLPPKDDDTMDPNLSSADKLIIDSGNDAGDGDGSDETDAAMLPLSQKGLIDAASL